MTFKSEGQSPKISSEMVVVESFLRSLRNLQIEPARFRSLGLSQRKLAVEDAVSSRAAETLKNLDWMNSRCNFGDKTISDFSLEEITKHREMLDVLIAYVLMGEANFVPTLITYLGFPEPRWKLLIAPILRALFGEQTAGISYGLPSDIDVKGWRNWAVHPGSSTRLTNYVSTVMRAIGPPVSEFYVMYHDNVPNAYSDILYDHYVERWRRFDHDQFNFYYWNLHSKLASNELVSFTTQLDEFIRVRPNAQRYDTLVACIKDQIDSLGLSKIALKRFWLHEHGDVSPLTFCVLFDILNEPSLGRRLANDFANHIIGTQYDHVLVESFGDILLKSHTDRSVKRLAMLLVEGEGTTSKTASISVYFVPRIRMILSQWVGNMFGKEIDAICAVGSANAQSRDELSDLLCLEIKRNSKILQTMALPTSQSPGSKVGEFRTQMLILWEYRSRIQEMCGQSRVDIHSLSAEYESILHRLTRDTDSLIQTSRLLELLGKIE